MTRHHPPRPDATRGAAAMEQHLTFEVAGELFAIPVLSVQEIRSWDKVSVIPRAPSYVLGVIDLRGVMVPILDLRRRLSITPREPTPTTAVIVVRVADDTGAPVVVGWVVDSVSDVADVDPTAVRPAPEVLGSVDSHFLSGLSTLDSRLLLLLDLGRLIETATIGALAA
jgi:purine-binding chemotaxis protein CheW